MRRSVFIAGRGRRAAAFAGARGGDNGEGISRKLEEGRGGWSKRSALEVFGARETSEVARTERETTRAWEGEGTSAEHEQEERREREPRGFGSARPLSRTRDYEHTGRVGSLDRQAESVPFVRDHVPARPGTDIRGIEHALIATATPFHFG